MIACSGPGMALVLAHGRRPRVIINFINWPLGLTLTPELTRPLWDLLVWILLGHYGSAIVGCASKVK